jgi:MFS family permease
MLTPSTAGILVTASLAQRMAQRRSQRLLVIAGFATTLVGLVLVLTLTREQSSVLSSVPGLFLVGAGIGVMLTSSVNVVQSAFPEADQGDISGVSRSVSNLGSSLGVALAGSMMVIAATPGWNPFAASLIVMIVVGALGLLAAFLIPHKTAAPAESRAA